MRVVSGVEVDLSYGRSRTSVFRARGLDRQLQGHVYLRSCHGARFPDWYRASNSGVTSSLLTHPLRAGIPCFYAVSLYNARFELYPHLKKEGKDNWRELFIRQPSWTEGDPSTVEDKETHPLDFLVSPCKWV